MANSKPVAPSPASDSILGRLYQASPEGLAVLMKTVPSQTRAALAIYCLHRKQLKSIGLTIAASCDRRDLLCQGGSPVLDLIQKLRTSEQSFGKESQEPAA